MNKQNLSYVVGIVMFIFLIGFSIAEALDRSDDTISISSEAKTTLADEGITNPQTTELICDGSYCRFKMYQGDYRLGKHIISEKECSQVSVCGEEVECVLECLSWTIYNTNELQNIKKEKIENWLEDYAEVLDKRELIISSETKLGEGTITIQEK